MTWRGVSVVPQEREGDVGIVHVFLRIRVALFVADVVFRFRQSLYPAHRDLAFSSFFLSFRRIHLRSRVLLLRIVFSFLVSFSFPFVVFVVRERVSEGSIISSSGFRLHTSSCVL